MDRIARLLSTSTRSSRILEIGPSHVPVAPKAAGWNTFVVDHADRQELRRKFAALGVNTDAIEEVDAIWEGGALHEIVPAELHGQFDTLIGSHVIEHIPDLAGFLISVQSLLAPTGVVALAVPDRRYGFDFFKPPTLTGDVLEAHAAKRSRHARHTQWNQAAYSATWDGVTAWGQYHISQPAFTNSFAAAAATQRALDDDQSAPYIDCHAWHFTPASFALVILELGQLGVIDWHIDTLHGPAGCEYFAFLRRGANRINDPVALQAERMRLLREQLVETREQIEFTLASGDAPEVSPTPVASQQLEEMMSMLRDQQTTLQAIQLGETQQRTEMMSLLHNQQTTLREIQITSAWVREILRPMRALRRCCQAFARRRASSAFRAAVLRHPAHRRRPSADSPGFDNRPGGASRPFGNFVDG